MMKVFFTILMLCVMALSCGAVDAQNQAAAAEVDYRVDISEPEGNALEITMELYSSAQTLALDIPDSYGEELAVELASHIDVVKAVDAAGEPVTVSQEGETWLIEGAGEITVSYRVELSGYTTGTDYLQALVEEGAPWPFFPILEQDLAYLPGYAIFLHPVTEEGLLPSLELVLPEGWRLALPWSGQPKSMEELLLNPIYAGDLVLQEQGSLLVALPSSCAAASGTGLEEYAEKTASLLSETEGLLGESITGEGEKLLVALLFLGEQGTAEGPRYLPASFTRTIVLSAPSRTNLLSDGNIEATSRGLSQLLFPSSIALDREALWLKQGTAWYFQDLVPYRAGIWGAATFWERFSKTYDGYRDARDRCGESLAASGTLANQDPDASALLCDGGAVACATLDSEMQSLQTFGEDFASFLRDLAQLDNGGSPLSNSDLQSLLQRITARDFSSFFRDYIEGLEEIPVSAFSSLNIAEPDEVEPEAEEPQGSTSTTGWILLGVALCAVFIIPFILEPYTMRPRKPGWLEKIKEE
ncbi:MAG: hypothetical protein SWK76_12730 [Actinomycetota bacterium]|nr:hypothetical protein [Actinomycetota bacterium]